MTQFDIDIIFVFIMSAGRVLKLLKVLGGCRIEMLQGSGRSRGGWSLDIQTPKLRVERQPLLASIAVVFGVKPPGPHVLVVIFKSEVGHLPIQKKGLIGGTRSYYPSPGPH
jgi:hypothetical protein